MGLGVAIRSFFRALTNRDFSKQVGELLAGSQTPALPAGERVSSAADLLAALQREGRFVDFLCEQVEGFSDAEIGSVARGVHQGCRKVLEQYLEVTRVLSESEGDPVTVEVGFDPVSIRLVGRVEGDPPFKGVLRHHGWKLTRAKLPEASTGEGAPVLLPAEVEL